MRYTDSTPYTIQRFSRIPHVSAIPGMSWCFRVDALGPDKTLNHCFCLCGFFVVEISIPSPKNLEGSANVALAPPPLNEVCGLSAKMVQGLRKSASQRSRGKQVHRCVVCGSEILRLETCPMPPFSSQGASVGGLRSPKEKNDPDRKETKKFTLGIKGIPQTWAPLVKRSHLHTFVAPCLRRGHHADYDESAFLRGCYLWHSSRSYRLLRWVECSRTSFFHIPRMSLALHSLRQTASLADYSSWTCTLYTHMFPLATCWCRPHSGTSPSCWCACV